LTGKSDFLKTKVQLTWRGVTELPKRKDCKSGDMECRAWWDNHHVVISDPNDPTVLTYSTDQFPPGEGQTFGWKNGVNRNAKFSIFTSPLYRNIDLVFDKRPDDIKGIDVLRFKADPSTFKKSVDADIEYSGFLNLGKMGSFSKPVPDKDGLPVWLSNPHFVYVNETDLGGPGWNVEGVSEPDPEIHETYLDIDPRVGYTLRARQRLQFNWGLQQNWFVTGTKSNDHKVIPVFWAERSATIDDEIADAYKSGVFFALKLRDDLTIAFCVIGALLFVGGIVLYCFKRKEGDTK
jgi:hypothetical protein